MEENNVQQPEMVGIPHDYLIQGVKDAVTGIRKEMADARAKYGDRYNVRNDFEMFDRRFGYDDPEAIWREFSLVFENKSSAPASIRKVLAVIGNSARYNAIERMRRELMENEKESENGKEE